MKKNPREGGVLILDDSIGNYPLEVQKEIAEGVLWAKREFRMKTWLESVTRASLPDKVFGDYTKQLLEIRPRTNLSLEDAFTTSVHEMVHHSQYLTGIDCVKII